MSAVEQTPSLELEPTSTLDCRGMQCPAPILELSKAARAAGKQPAVLEIIVDDSDFPSDVKAWCRASKNELLNISEQSGVYVAHVGLNLGVQDHIPASSTRPASVAAPNASRPALVPEVSNEPSPSPRFDVDCRGMQCPAPILAVAKKSQQVGKQPALLDIVATDAEFPTDLKAWCKAAKAVLVSVEQHGAEYRAVVALHGAQEAEPVAPNVPAQTPATVQAAATQKSDSSGTLDLRGLAAPQPIIQLSQQLGAQAGTTLKVVANDPSFMTDVMTWAVATKVEVLAIDRSGADTRVSLRFGGTGLAPIAVVPAVTPVAALRATAVAAVSQPANDFVGSSQSAAPQDALALCGTAEALTAAVAQGDPNLAERENRCTLLVIKNDFESLMAAMMCASTAAAQGMETSIFFSFWGVNVLRGERPRRDVPKEKVNVLQKMMQWMMPRGPQRQKMSKMHMGGMGKGMMVHFMKQNNVLTLEQLMGAAAEQNVKFIVCSMSMGIMGIQKRDIVDLPNVEFAGVSTFIELSRRSSMSLVF